MKLQSSACGKCILFGEHSILEGGSALSLPLTQLKIEIEFEEKKENRLEVNFPLQEKDEKIFWSVIHEDFSEFQTQGSYVIKSNLPIGAGLGSSAALCIALNRLFRKNISPQELIERSWKNEFRFHGKSSGIDPTTIVCKKALHFISPSHYSEIKFPQNFNSEYVFILFDSKLRRQTHSIIQQSQSLKDTNPQAWKKAIGELQSFALKAKDFIENNQIISLGSLMNDAHSLLGEIGASNSELNTLQKKILEAGGMGAKLTGAGRGGFLLALFNLKTWNTLKTREDSQLRSFFQLLL